MDKNINYTISNAAFFNKVFSKREVLAKFLSILWQREIDSKNVEIIHPEISSKERSTLYDIFALVEHNNVMIRLNLEMQNYDRPNIRKE